MHTIKLALDWTPNINHIGFLIAKELGFYYQKGIGVEIISPSEDNYQLTPGKKLELGLVDFAIAPFETVISFNNKANSAPFIAVFAILQEDLSCIATLNRPDIHTPKDLDNKIYASYKARYEDAIVKQMIINAGGKGTIRILYPDKLGIWNTLLENKADATWIFDNWEGAEALTKGIQLKKFRLKDYGIPYAYSPVLISHADKLNHNQELYANFVKATREGFLYAQQNRPQSISILKNYLSYEENQKIDIEKAFSMTAQHFGDTNTCGLMKKDRVSNFLEWLVEHKLENPKILEQNLFTNELL